MSKPETDVRAERERLLEFGSRSVVPEGFGWLTDAGEVDPSRGVPLWITARMTHVFSSELAHGAEQWREVAEHGVRCLTDGPLRDAERGGWFSGVGGDFDVRKVAYDNCFVLLAGASASRAGLADGTELLAEAWAVWHNKFWDGTSVNESFDCDWSDLEDYRGANAHMHAVEAMLAVHGATGDASTLVAALAITDRLTRIASQRERRMPEHFTGSWEVREDYNSDDPAHPFRPYGVTIGHLLEWSRLCVELGGRLGSAAPSWLLSEAQSLYARALEDGWAVDGRPGFVYTVDFSGRPVVRQRMHWVIAEAIAAAVSLEVATGETSYGRDARRFLQHARDHFVDPRGSWRHELGPDLKPASGTWVGKPDIYHAYGALTHLLMHERSLGG